MARSGFRHEMLIESNRDAVDTLMLNHDAGQDQIKSWDIHHEDIRNVSFREFEGKLSALAGGPPCQPFSLGGKHRAHDDGRDMFPQAIRAVRKSSPDTFIFENVKGLLRQKFSSYFGYVLLQLAYPGLMQRKGEPWQQHLSRLEETRANYKGLEYKVAFRLLNAADYGVPQRRERVFIVGFRNDLGDVGWDFPKASHSQDALLWGQWVTGDYWTRLDVPKEERPKLADGGKAIASRLQKKYGAFPPKERPWVTIREAIRDLPRPEEENGFNNHVYRGGARCYPGHTGSPIDEPSKALKAGDHGVPRGENMIRFNDGSVRYLTVREAARIQAFPDDYHIAGTWTECMRQIGNAVPVALAEAVAGSVYEALAYSR